MKTKEEIIGSYPIIASNSGDKLYVSRNDTMKAMDEYAKQQCIAYAHFLFRKLYPIMMVPSDPPKEESEILYNQFIEQQQSKQP